MKQIKVILELLNSRQGQLGCFDREQEGTKQDSVQLEGNKRKNITAND